MGHNSPNIIETENANNMQYAQLDLVWIIPVKFGWNCISCFWGVVRTSFVMDGQTDGQTDDGKVIPKCHIYSVAGNTKIYTKISGYLEWHTWGLKKICQLFLYICKYKTCSRFSNNMLIWSQISNAITSRFHTWKNFRIIWK